MARDLPHAGVFEMKQLYLATGKFLRDEEGVTVIEYALIAALLALAVAVTVAAVGNQLNTLFTRVKNCLINSGNCA
jgi:pilus assembly protein Flp/PilA